MRVFAPALVAASAFALASAQLREITEEEEIQANAAQLLLGANDAVVPACVPPSSPVLLHLQSCFTGSELGQINSWFKNSVISLTKDLYVNNQPVDVKSYSYFQAGTCSAFNNFVVQTGVNVHTPSAKPRFFIQEGIPRTNIRTAIFYDYTGGSEALRVNGNGVINSVLNSPSTEKVVRRIYCGPGGANPTTFIDASNQLQCGCCETTRGRCKKCDDGMFPDTTGKCRCPADTAPGAYGCDACPEGYASPNGDKCKKICENGKRNKPGSDDECELDCKDGWEEQDGKCVRQCFWTANNDDKLCKWTSSSSKLQMLKDCKLHAPVPKDNYVNDKRVNKEGVDHAPLITIETVVDGDKSAFTSSWLDFAEDPTVLENDVEFTKFGVYDLKMVATDYRGDAKCTGCIAVVDDHPPRSTEVCPVESVTVAYADGGLATAIEKEDAFTAFYDEDNVYNNLNADGDANDRCDHELNEVTDFFKQAEKRTSLDTKCFDNNLLKDLVNAVADKSLDITQESQPVCKRCCTKEKTLKEFYYEYSCSKAPKQQVATGDACSLDVCVTVAGTDLVVPTVSVTQATADRTQEVLDGLDKQELMAMTAGDDEPIKIHEVITCTNFDQGCKFEPTLGQLFKREVEWTQALAGFSQQIPDDVAHWRYATEKGTWKTWSDSDKLTFIEAQTDVYVSVMTHCGGAMHAHFSVVLHPHTDHTSACTDLDKKWVFDPLNTLLPGSDRTVCTYPKSDFTVLTFNFDGKQHIKYENNKAEGSYTKATCTVKLNDRDSSTPVSAIQVLEFTADAASHIDASKQVALELVRDPTTAKNTDVEIECTFTFTYFGTGATTADETCSHSFIMTDCDKPEIERLGDQEVCEAGKCLDPDSAGAYEPCGGTVFGVTGSGSLATTIRSFSNGNPCCTNCGNGHSLTCKALDATVTAGVKRCEPEPVKKLMSAMALGAEASSVEAARSETLYTMGVTVAGVSAMVAAVAVVVVARRRRSAEHVKADDAYYALLE